MDSSKANTTLSLLGIPVREDTLFEFPIPHSQFPIEAKRLDSLSPE